MSVKNQLYTLVFCGILLSSCQQSINEPFKQDKPPDLQRKTASLANSIQLIPRDNHYQLQFNLDLKSFQRSFTTQALDCGAPQAIRAAITGIGISNPIYIDGANPTSHLANITSNEDCQAQFNISNIPFGKARIATIDVFRSNNLNDALPGGQVKAAFHAEPTTTQVAINFATSPGAMVIEHMLSQNQSLLVSKLDLGGLQSFINSATGVSGTFPEITYSTHPTLIKATDLANDLIGNQGDLSSLNAANYTQSGGNVPLQIIFPGTANSIEVVMRDPASQQVILDNGPYASPQNLNIPATADGNWQMEVVIEPNGSPVRRGIGFPSVSFNPGSSQTVDFTTAINVTDLKVDSVSRFSGSADPTPDAIDIVGTNFTGVTGVHMGGVDIVPPALNVTSTNLTFTMPPGTNTGQIKIERDQGAHVEVVGIPTFFTLSSAGELNTSSTGMSTNEAQTQALAYASGSGKFLAVWQSNASGNVYGRVIDGNGTPEGGAGGFQLNTIGSTGGLTLPDVTYNPDLDEFLVVWQINDGSQDDIYARRVKPDAGDPVSLGGDFQVTTQPNDQVNPSVAYNATDQEYLVVWEDDRNQVANDVDIYGATIDDIAGAQNINEVPIQINQPLAQYNPRLAWNKLDNQYLVVWNSDNTEEDVLAQRYNASDLSPIGGILNIANDAGEVEERPDVAYNEEDNHYLVVYSDDLGAGNAEVYSRFVEPNGTLAPSSEPVIEKNNQQMFARVAWNSSNNEYMVVYDDNDASPTDIDIYARRISNDLGRVGSPGRMNVSTNANNQYQPVIAYNPDQHNFLVLWRDDNGSPVSRLQKVEGP